MKPDTAAIKNGSDMTHPQEILLHSKPVPMINCEIVVKNFHYHRQLLVCSRR